MLFPSFAQRNRVTPKVWQEESCHQLALKGGGSGLLLPRGRCPRLEPSPRPGSCRLHCRGGSRLRPTACSQLLKPPEIPFSLNKVDFVFQAHA